jgi:hypothetical protein
VIRFSLIFLGFVLGIGLGLLYGWQISPVQYTNTDPASLRADYKEQYLALVAASYKGDHDLDRARVRLSRLKDPSVSAALAAFAQRLAAQNKAEAGDVALLAADLNDAGQAAPTPPPTPGPTAPSPTPIPPTPSLPAATFAAPSPTFSPQPEFDYVLLKSETYCNDDQRKPLIIVDVVDANSAPLPGVRVSVRWADGQDGFVTGLKPEISASYGDFLMTVGLTYSVQVGARTPAVTGLTAPICTAAQTQDQYPGAVRLVFQRK